MLSDIEIVIARYEELNPTKTETIWILREIRAELWGIIKEIDI